MTTPDATDWHPANIVARLHMAGTSLRQLAKTNKLYPTALSVALQRPWLRAEGIIAAAIGVAPEQIWPSRYAKRQTKLAHRKNQQHDPAASINQCSHGCNANVKSAT